MRVKPIDEKIKLEVEFDVKELESILHILRQGVCRELDSGFGSAYDIENAKEFLQLVERLI